MSSAAENLSTPPAPDASEPPSSGRGKQLVRSLERWNRKLHFYSGLFFLFFLWLFALTGILLNHPTWKFHESWLNRHEVKYVREIVAPPPEATSDLQQAQDLMRQLSIDGEILWTAMRAIDTQMIFQVRTPRHFYFINADWAKKLAEVRHADVNGWGLMKILHTFSGNIRDDTRNQRDWALTTLWAYSMDVVAIGLIYMTLSGIYMWLKLPRKQLTGAMALALGCLACGFFVIGLRWLY